MIEAGIFLWILKFSYIYRPMACLSIFWLSFDAINNKLREALCFSVIHPSGPLSVNPFIPVDGRRT